MISKCRYTPWHLLFYSNEIRLNRWPKVPFGEYFALEFPSDVQLPRAGKVHNWKSKLSPSLPILIHHDKLQETYPSIHSKEKTSCSKLLTNASLEKNWVALKGIPISKIWYQKYGLIFSGCSVVQEWLQIMVVGSNPFGLIDWIAC